MRLIDADALLEDMGEEPMNWTNSPEEIQEYIDWKQTVAIINSAQTIEAEPVRHGHWIEKDWDDGDYVCSACGHSWVTIEGTPQDNEMNYCPYCGAHMDEVSE